MQFSIQYVSDLHLEYDDEDNFIIEPVSNNLALCGDIGIPGSKKYHSFIEKCSQNFKNVFVVYGNHEFYDLKNNNETMDIRKFYSTYFPQNVYFLDNKAIFLDTITNEVIDNLNNTNTNTCNTVKIIGTTLWSDVEPFIQHCINDYKLIKKDFNSTLNYKDVKQMFNDNVKYILQELDKERDIKSVLLSHHGPHPVFNGEIHKKSPLTSGFVSYIPDLYEKTNLIACISGHTHCSVDTIVKEANHEIYMVSNQRGYPGENVVFNASKTITISL